MYKFLLETPFGKQWKKIGVNKRAGVIFPLFSLYSKKSAGIGEIPDLKLAIDWCKITGNTILQILPLNDTGFQSSPFSSQTSIGLNPLYISLSSLIGVKDTKKEKKHLQTIFPIDSPLDYRIGKEKIKTLKSVFNKGVELPKEFNRFIKDNSGWLEDFCLFRALKNYHREKSWKRWEQNYSNRDQKSIKEFRKNNKKEISFWRWVQWQAFEQMKEVKVYAKKNNILIKGDIPLFVSDDSVDCWVNRKYFKMELASGSPPDKFSKKSQIWGMPPYDWEKIMENGEDGLDFFLQRVLYAENFYDLFRIDHVIGLFRTWSIKSGAKSEVKGFYSPKNISDQKERGEKIFRFMTKRLKILPCAEDLGTIPNFCRKALEKFGIPGLDVDRWQKKYRQIAVSTLSTHDMSLFPVWLKKNSLDSEQQNIEKGIYEVLSSPSIFSTLLIFEWLFFSGTIDIKDAKKYRINKPGTKSTSNWTIRMPLSMEELLNDPLNEKVKKAIEDSGRN